MSSNKSILWVPGSIFVLAIFLFIVGLIAAPKSVPFAEQPFLEQEGGWHYMLNQPVLHEPTQMYRVIVSRSTQENRRADWALTAVFPAGSFEPAIKDGKIFLFLLENNGIDPGTTKAAASRQWVESNNKWDSSDQTVSQ